MQHTIPKITNELGRHWDQPRRESILVDDSHALMDVSTFDKLADYSATVPTGAYEGKMWKRRVSGDQWLLCWYGAGKSEDTVATLFRKILIA